MSLQFNQMTVPQLQAELKKRKAKISGKKCELVRRLEAYDRHSDFTAPEIQLPPQVSVEWPTAGFRQICPSDAAIIPPISEVVIEGYFRYRLALDRQICNDLKALTKGKGMFECEKVTACSSVTVQGFFYASGIVSATMKKKVTYYVKLKLGPDGEILNSACECPSGTGPHGTCKHSAAMLFMLMHLKETKTLKLSGSCTDTLQTFHHPQKKYEGSPMKAQDVSHREPKLTDYRPIEFVNHPGYQDHVRNSVFNFCYTHNHDLPMRYLYKRASLQAAAQDHDYLQLKFTEHWVDNSLQLTQEKAEKVEEQTRGQSSSRLWHLEREWRLTSSTFGTIYHSTALRNIDLLCRNILFPPDLSAQRSVIYRKQCESLAISKFEEDTNLKVDKAGLCIDPAYPYLGASPDGFIGLESTVEVKCPYSGKEGPIQPGKNFPFLHYEDGNIRLRGDHPYYSQVQGQLAISKRKQCYFIVYCPAKGRPTILVDIVLFDQDFWSNHLLPKLMCFYHFHFRPYVATHALALR